MSLPALIVFLPALLNGILLAHLLWPERDFWAVVFKLFLGAGLGMGLRSLAYFLYLLVLPGQHLYVYLDLALLTVMIVLTVAVERRLGRSSWSQFRLPRTTLTQRFAVAIAGIVVIVSLVSTASYLLRRRQGDWDAWMMYNRAARFLYADQANWLDSFSPIMDPIFHADYPLLLAGNIAAGWDILGRESASIPMLQSALFSIAGLGLLAATLASVKTIGQAMLGVLIVWGAPVFVNEGARQMADVPIAFFILATAGLLALYVIRPHTGLIVLGGLTAGLGAWTKNEGAVLIVGAGLALASLVARGRQWRMLLPFAAGLALPLLILIYFRLFLAPSGDILSAATAGSASQVLDASRHSVILRHLWSEVLGFGSWGIAGLAFGILPILLIYALLFCHRPSASWAPALRAGFIILVVQVLGYYAAYLVSPYDLAWHLAYSSTRIVLQVFPLLVFLILSTATDVETVFGRRIGLPSE